MLVGRLGLETARLPHADRHGLIYLDRGRLGVESGALAFSCAGGGGTPAGDYVIPHQSISLVLLGPGGSVSQDALRLLARHGAALTAVGEDGVRCYTAQPLLPDFSHLARRQAALWADEKKGRMQVARRMYALRLREVLPHRDIAVLRGIEGARVKEIYRLVAERVGVPWHGRRYDRADPTAADLPNQALNHVASAVEGAAAIAVAATATIPQLGFIHEDSGQSFVLDVADLFRDDVTVPVAFRAAKAARSEPALTIERLARRMAGEALRKRGVIAAMIDRIKTLFEDQAAGATPKRKVGAHEAPTPDKMTRSETKTQERMNEEGAVTRDDPDEHDGDNDARRG